MGFPEDVPSDSGYAAHPGVDFVSHGVLVSEDGEPLPSWFDGSVVEWNEGGWFAFGYEGVAPDWTHWYSFTDADGRGMAIDQDGAIRALPSGRRVRWFAALRLGRAAARARRALR